MSPIKKIVIIGPESTGKSTLTSALAEEFKEPFVEEYARQYLENLPREYEYKDLLEIAKGQLALEDQKEKQAANLLFCDTDLHVIQVWSQHKFNKTDPWVLEQISKRNYDLYLLTDIDTPWQDDPLREHPEPVMRRYFMDRYEHLLFSSGIPYVRVSGNHTERLQQAIRLVRKSFL